jgi:hypothetical protein
MNFKYFVPYMLAVTPAAAFAWPGGVSIAVTPRSPATPATTIVGTVVRGVASPIVTTIVTGTLPSPTTLVVKAIQSSTMNNPALPSAKAPTAIYVPPSKEDKETMNEPNAETDMTPQAGSKADDYLMIIEEPKPIFHAPDACEVISVKTVDLNPIDQASLKRDQKTTTAVVGTMEMYPTANGRFVRHKLLNKDAFVVSFDGRLFRHRRTFYLDNNAIVYQGNELTKLDFLRRGDPVEVSFVQSGNRYVAVAVESNRTGEYVASR